jgi:hypothetical protein
MRKRQTPPQPIFRHYFRFRFDDGREFVARARVRIPRRAVQLKLSAENVQRSIDANGAGNTQTCAMSMCARSQRDAFPHPVDGFIDWYYRRAYVVSKVDRYGLPAECYVYAHNDQIAQLNDSRDGQKALLRDLKANGDRVVRLLVPPRRSPEKRGHIPTGNKTGTRDRTVSLGVGARRRFAVVHLGLTGLPTVPKDQPA